MPDGDAEQWLDIEKLECVKGVEYQLVVLCRSIALFKWGDILSFPWG